MILEVDKTEVEDESEDDTEDGDDNEGEEDKKQAAVVTHAHAMESISILRNYCLQQEFSREIRDQLDSFDRNTRSTRLRRTKNSPSLLNFYSVLGKQQNQK